MSAGTPQPIPDVTVSDVERVVRRDYHPGQVDEVLALLRTYGTESWEREATRVRVAILKLAEGDLSRLREQLAVAKQDYRDVLLGAEYLAYAALTLRTPRPLPAEARQAIDADWSAYQEWLRR
jgi:hypothetical protein